MPENVLQLPLTDRFADALGCACAWHRTQARKDTQIPYVSHLLAVAALALENGADEDVAIAALLHDAVEDGGGRARLVEIRSRFGDRVAKIVEECSDSDVQPKPPWDERKAAYIAHVPHASKDAVLVSMCDKLHNARTILADLEREGAAVWGRFSKPRDKTLWYYRSLVDAFARRGAPPPLAELQRVVKALEQWQPPLP